MSIALPLSEFSVEALVNELRKRDGVKTYVVSEEQSSTIEVCQQDKEKDPCIYTEEFQGHAIILKVID